MKNFKFYLAGFTPTENDFDYLYLANSNWDDYTSQTSFSLYFSSKTGGYDIPIGSVKIMHYKESITQKIIPKEFDHLPFNEFCSLGQDLEYYFNLKRNFPNDYVNILKSLNDSAYFESVADKFRHHFRFRQSLLRNSEAEKAFHEAQAELKGEEIERDFNFHYQTNVEYADQAHKVRFNFNTESEIPNRIIALIGENGTGKTQFLANLAIDLSGNNELKDYKEIAFKDGRPHFSKVIAISYSIFDNFSRPEADHSFSYVYCGLKDSGGNLLSLDDTLNNYQDSLERIRSFHRSREWYNMIGSIVGEEQVERLEEELYHERNYDILGELSSGQSFLIYVLTQLVGNIKPNSLILFDEPEMHLHPNAISNLIRSLDSLLNKFDSYAIVATHSPIIIQEIPSDFVMVFDRIGNTPYIHNLNLQSFGESIEILTQEVFKTKDVEDNYKKFFKRISKNKSYKEVLQLFKNRLSLNAKSYLLNLYDNPEQELQ